MPILRRSQRNKRQCPLHQSHRCAQATQRIESESLGQKKLLASIVNPRSNPWTLLSNLTTASQTQALISECLIRMSTTTSFNPNLPRKEKLIQIANLELAPTLESTKINITVNQSSATNKSLKLKELRRSKLTARSSRSVFPSPTSRIHSWTTKKMRKRATYLWIFTFQIWEVNRNWQALHTQDRWQGSSRASTTVSRPTRATPARWMTWGAEKPLTCLLEVSWQSFWRWPKILTTRFTHLKKENRNSSPSVRARLILSSCRR